MNDKKVTITILNWDKYQREMKGGESRRRRREWIAISVDLFSDPDFLAMDQMHRTAWVGLLCHAGKVGPRFELCPSDARLLFRLRRSPDFRVFKNQGFIDLHTATNKTNNTNKTVHRPSAKKAKKKTPKTATRFDDFWVVYPRKVKKPDAKKAWERDNLDTIADKIISHVEKRKVGDDQWVRDGGKYIQYPATFLNGQMWEDEFGEIKTTIPVKPRRPEVVTDDMLRRDREKADRELAALMEKR